MNNVRSMTAAAAATVEDAKTWLKSMGDRGFFKSTTARFRISAIDTFCSILGPEEPREVEYILGHLDEIAVRWATIKNSSGTAADYKSRVKTGLTDYLAFLKDPMNFKPKNRDSEGSRKERAEKPTKKQAPEAELPLQPPAPPAAPSGAIPPSGAMRSFPVGAAGESIEFRIPVSGIEVRDALKFAIHLATLAKDFDPTSAMSARVFALARTDETA